MRKQILTAAALASCAGTTSAFAVDVGANTTIGGSVFMDVSHISLQNQNAAGTYVDAPPTGTGFDVKRFYFIVNHTFNDVWSANLTTDAQYSTASTATVCTAGGTPPTCNGTTSALTNQNTSGGASEVFIKKLYLQGKFSEAFVVHVGSYDLPWIPFVETMYGYRYVEKLTVDRLGFGTTTDWGLNATGVFGPNGMFTYAGAVVNGGGFKNPTRTKDVDFEGRISVRPVDIVTLAAGFYSGHLAQVTASNEHFPTNTATRWDGLAALNIGGLRAAVEYFNSKNYKTVNSVAASVYGTSSVVTTSGAAPISDQADGISTWVSYDFTAQWGVFGRYDNAKLSKDVAPNLKDEYFNLGVAYRPIKPVDFALVYKNERVNNGSNTISGGNAGGSYTIGGANGTRSGKFDEFGVYAWYRF